jgi:hypothetical protein
MQDNRLKIRTGGDMHIHEGIVGSEWMRVKPLRSGMESFHVLYL